MSLHVDDKYKNKQLTRRPLKTQLHQQIFNNVCIRHNVFADTRIPSPYCSRPGPIASDGRPAVEGILQRRPYSERKLSLFLLLANSARVHSMLLEPRFFRSFRMVHTKHGNLGKRCVKQKFGYVHKDTFALLLPPWPNRLGQLTRG